PSCTARSTTGPAWRRTRARPSTSPCRRHSRCRAWCCTSSSRKHREEGPMTTIADLAREHVKQGRSPPEARARPEAEAPDRPAPAAPAAAPPPERESSPLMLSTPAQALMPPAAAMLTEDRVELQAFDFQGYGNGAGQATLTIYLDRARA